MAAIFIVPAAYAKPYKALTKEVSSPVEIPDEVIFPDYISRLLLIEKDEGRRAIDHSPLIINLFVDPEFQYFNEEGKEVYPYGELIKVERNSSYLIYFYFINEKNEHESYEDPKSLWKPATSKLEKEAPSKEDGKLKKVPREKQNP